MMERYGLRYQQLKETNTYIKYLSKTDIVDLSYPDASQVNTFQWSISL